MGNILANFKRTVDWSLTGQLLEHFGGAGESIAGFANRNVENEFFDAELSHWVAVLVAFFLLRLRKALVH